jgi:hypothetical protein
MADQQDPAVAALLALQENVYVPVFVKACSAKGLVPSTPEDVQNLLLIAEHLKRAELERNSGLVQVGANLLQKASGVQQPVRSNPVISAAIRTLNEAR